jgi:hypothetical protein
MEDATAGDSAWKARDGGRRSPPRCVPDRAGQRDVAKIQALKIIDPETKAPAVKNPFLHPKPGVLLVDDMAVDRLLANGTVIGACNVALQVQIKMLAGNAGASAEEAAKEWAANVVPGITIIPSGTWGVNRAQEAGCTYCASG